jgi:hypothetical protein
MKKLVSVLIIEWFTHWIEVTLKVNSKSNPVFYKMLQSSNKILYAKLIDTFPL